jgi:hypothetical protein
MPESKPQRQKLRLRDASPEVRPRKITIAACRSQAVTRLIVYCENFAANCYHSTTIPIAGFADALRLDEVEARCRCTKCGAAQCEVRPDFPKAAGAWNGT